MFDSGISQKDLIDEVIKEMDVAENIPYSKYEYWYNSLIQLLYSEIVKEGQSRTVTVDIENNQADIRLEDINAGDGTIEVPRFEDVTAVFVNGYELSRSTFISGTHLRNSYWSKGSDSITIWTDYGEGDTDVEIRFNVRPNVINSVPRNYIIDNINYKKIVDETNTGDSVASYSATFEVDLGEVLTSEIKSVSLYYGNTVEVINQWLVIYGGGISFNAARKTQSTGDETAEIFGQTYEDWINGQKFKLVVKGRFGESFYVDAVPLPYEFVELVRCKLRGEAYKLINDDALAAKWIGEYNTLLENFKVYIASHGSMYGRY